MSFTKGKDYIIPVLIGVVLGLIIKTFLFQVVKVHGLSMYPTYNDKQILLLNKLDNKYKQGDVIVFDSNDETAPIYIKRLIGLPNDHIVIKNNTITINNKKLEEKYIPKNIVTMGDIDMIIPKDEYFVLGDNRENSKDSRIIGTINKNQILGKILITKK